MKEKLKLIQSSQLNFKTIKLDESIKGTDLNNLIVSENYEYQLDEQGNLIITEEHHNTENNTESNGKSNRYASDR